MTGSPTPRPIPQEYNIPEPQRGQAKPGPTAKHSEIPDGRAASSPVTHIDSTQSPITKRQDCRTTTP